MRVLGVGALRSDDGAGYDHDHYDNAVHFDNSTWSLVFTQDTRPAWHGHHGTF